MYQNEMNQLGIGMCDIQCKDSRSENEEKEKEKEKAGGAEEGTAAGDATLASIPKTVLSICG